MKVALVGCGKIADGHVEQVRAIGSEMLAVCDREPLMAEQLAIRMNIPAHYDDLATMLAAEKPQMLHIATPPDSHVALARIGLAHGCHLFIEKPFALNATDTEAIYAMAQDAKRRVSVNYLYNYEPPALELEALLRAGALGKLVHLESSYGYDLTGDYGVVVLSDADHWVHGLPGKLFHNVLDHVVAKFARHIGDDFDVKVQAFRRRAASGVPVIDAMADELRFMLRSDDLTVGGMVSAHGRPVSHSLRVIGSRDTVDLDYASRTLIHAANQSQPSAIGRLFPPWTQSRQYAANGFRNLRRFARSRAHFFECMRELLTRYYASVEAGAPDPIPPAEVIRVARVIDAIVAGIAADAARQESQS